MQSITFANADELIDSMDGNYIQFTIPKAEVTSSHLEVVALGEIQILQHAFDFGGNAVGSTSPEIYSFLFATGGQVFSKGKPYLQNTLLFHPPGDEFFNHTSGPHCMLGIYIPKQIWENYLLAQFDDWKKLSPAMINVDPLKMQILRCLVRDICEQQHLGYSLTPDKKAGEFLQRGLLHTLANIVWPGNSSLQGHSGEKKFRMLLQAMRNIDSHLDLHLGMDEIAEDLHISRRGLQNLFVEQLCLSPLKFMNLRRLSLARQAIRTRHHEKTSIAEIAMRHGFWHFGRFAATYRKTFGELPSETISTKISPSSSIKNKLHILDNFFFQ